MTRNAPSLAIIRFEKASGSFLKKRTKKLLLIWPVPLHIRNSISKSLFGSFSSEKELLAYMMSLVEFAG
jgi:hypothetical protein